MTAGRQIRGVDPVAVLGSLVGLVALLFPFVLVKENRVDRGLPFFLPEAPALLLLVLPFLILSLYLGLRRSGTRAASALGMISAVLLIATPWYAAGLIGNTLLGAALPYGRISPSTGIWLLSAAGGVLLHASTGKPGGNRAGRTLAGIAPILLLAVFLLTGALEELSIVKEYRIREARFSIELLGHLWLTFQAVAIAVLIGVPTALLIRGRKKLAEPVFLFVNGIQTVPSLALFGLLIAPLAALGRRFPTLRAMGIQGIGTTPALIALTLYALLPIVRNTFIAFSVVDPAHLDAGTGMGMSRFQLLRKVEFPIAFPVILSGLRISTVQAIGNATVAALIGAGGLGVFVFQGLGQAAPDLILLGVIPVVALAVSVDRLMEAIRLLYGRKVRAVDGGRKVPA